MPLASVFRGCAEGVHYRSTSWPFCAGVARAKLGRLRTKATSSARRVVLAARTSLARGAARGELQVFDGAISGTACAITPLSPAPERYAELLDDKARHVRKLLGDRLQVPMHVVASPPLHHRMKCTFAIRHQGDSVVFCVDDRTNGCWVAVEEYPIVCRRLVRLIADLREALRDDRKARSQAFQVEMLANTDDEALVCLMYHGDLGKDYGDVAASLAERLDATVVGRGKNKRVVAGPGRLVQRYEVDGRVYPQIQQELMFSQSNAHTCREMIQWVVRQTRKADGVPQRDLLELHCGNGNFTLPLSANFRKVLATEEVRESVKLAEECAAWAGVRNVHFARLSAKETFQAVRGERNFNRLKAVNLTDFDFSTILVDPPRCGLDAAALALVAASRDCVYVSCNPHRLVADLQAVGDHEVVAAAFFDQFPYTEHSEVAVLLKRG